MQERSLAERVSQLEAKLGRLTQDRRIGASLTGPFPVSESFMGLRRVDGTQCYMPGTLSIPTANWQTVSPSANYLYAFPFYAAAPVSVDRLTFHVNSTAAGNLRMGIFNSDKNLYPTNLVVDAGISSHNVALWRDIEFGKVRLTRGLKWVVILQQGTPTLTALPVNTHWAILGRTTAVVNHTGWGVSQAYGALPAKFPASASMITIVPLLLVRLVK